MEERRKPIFIAESARKAEKILITKSLSLMGEVR